MWLRRVLCGNGMMKYPKCKEGERHAHCLMCTTVMKLILSLIVHSNSSDKPQSQALPTVPVS